MPDTRDYLSQERLPETLPGAADRPAIRFQAPLIAARFRRREKRFLAEVDLPDGSRTWVHVPNSGALTGCLTPGMPILLTDDARPGRRTDFTWRFCRLAHTWVSIDTLAPNRLIRAALLGSGLPGLTQPFQFRPEVTLPHGGRLDFVVEKAGQLIFIEVKSVTWVEDGGLALFPDGVTSRGRRHLQELAALVRQGHAAWNIFVVQRQDARSMASAAQIDPAYAQELHRASEMGVKFLVFSTEIDPPVIRLGELLPMS